MSVTAAAHMLLDLDAETVRLQWMRRAMDMVLCSAFQPIIFLIYEPERLKKRLLLAKYLLVACLYGTIRSLHQRETGLMNSATYVSVFETTLRQLLMFPGNH
jgi:hypothetical protein